MWLPGTNRPSTLTGKIYENIIIEIFE